MNMIGLLGARKERLLSMESVRVLGILPMIISVGERLGNRRCWLTGRIAAAPESVR